MKKSIQLLTFLAITAAVLAFEGCDNGEDPTPLPVLTAPSAVTNVVVGAKADVTFEFTAAGGFTSSVVTASGGTATVKTDGTAGAVEGSVVVEFTADNSTGAASASLTITDAKGQTSSATAVINKTTVPTVELTGTLPANMTIEAGGLYLIKGTFIVPNGITLTVEAGAVVKGDKASKGVLIVKQGGTLNAIGTAADPIVFTSAQPVGARDRGDWGGIILMGDAYVNQSAKPSVEGLTPPASDADFFKYGTFSQSDATVGNNTQNSGTLKYVRIEYGGIELIPNSETNSLTMAAVGSGTTIDFVQASYGGDDGFEWFGGTVNATHLVSLATWDDDFDTDFGWRGNVQWGVAVRAPFVADQSGSTSFESDSQGNGNPIGTVCTDTEKAGCTKGVFSNMTILGPRDYSRAISGNYTRAMHIRRRTAISVFNSVITGYNSGVQLDDTGTTTNYAADNTGEGRLSNNVMVLSFLPAATSVASATPVTSIDRASGNASFGGASANGVSAQTVWEAGAAANTLTVPYFYAKWTSSAMTAQTVANTYASSASTVAGVDVLFATTPGWAAGAAVEVINPYLSLGLNKDAFYGGNTTGSYPSNPGLEITAGGTLATGASYTDGKLANFFDHTGTFKGAFGATDWTDGWSEFQPLNTAY